MKYDLMLSEKSGFKLCLHGMTIGYEHVCEQRLNGNVQSVRSVGQGDDEGGFFP